MRELQDILQFIWRLLLRVLGWAWREGWQRPKTIRGWRWATALWACALSTFAIASVLVRTHHIVLLGIQGTSLLIMDWQWHKPRKLGRDLPFKRHR